MIRILFEVNTGVDFTPRLYALIELSAEDCGKLLGMIDFVTTLKVGGETFHEMVSWTGQLGLSVYDDTAPFELTEEQTDQLERDERVLLSESPSEAETSRTESHALAVRSDCVVWLWEHKSFEGAEYEVVLTREELVEFVVSLGG